MLFGNILMAILFIDFKLMSVRNHWLVTDGRRRSATCIYEMKIYSRRTFQSGPSHIFNIRLNFGELTNVCYFYYGFFYYMLISKHIYRYIDQQKIEKTQ